MLHNHEDTQIQNSRFLFGLQLGLALESKLFSSRVNLITIQTWGGELSTDQLSPKAHLNS